MEGMGWTEQQQVDAITRSYKLQAEQIEEIKKKWEEIDERFMHVLQTLDQISNTMQILSGIASSFGVTGVGEFFKVTQGLGSAVELWKSAEKFSAAGDSFSAGLAKFNAVLTLVATGISVIGNIVKWLTPDYTKRSIEGFGKELGIVFSQQFVEQFRAAVEELKASGFSTHAARAVARATLIPQTIEEAGGVVGQAQWEHLERDLHWAFEELRKEGYTLDQTMAMLADSMDALADQIAAGNVSITDDFRAMISMMFQAGQATEDFFEKIGYVTEDDLRAWATETARGIRQGTVSLGEFAAQWNLLHDAAMEFGYGRECKGGQCDL